MEKWTTSRRTRYLPVCWALVALASLGAAPPVAGPKPADLDRPPPPLAPAEAAKRFKVADGLVIGLAASEPEVTQPLSISFDDRGRMWVLQYRQYPLPEGLKAGQGSLGRLMKDRQTADALEAALKHIEQVTARLNAGEGSLGKLLKDDAFLSSLASATSKMDLLVSKLNSSEGTAGKFINDPALFNRLTGVTERLEQLVTRLTEGEGTAGLLLKDKQLYENMNGAVGDLRTLLANIQRDPRRYLNVRVSIW